MKIIKSLILIVVLAGATYAGEMVQPLAPPAPPQSTTNAVTQMLVVIFQSFLPLR